jgi:hypothetical protein
MVVLDVVVIHDTTLMLLHPCCLLQSLILPQEFVSCSQPTPA